MSNRVPRFYWDSCVFLSYIHGLPDRLPDIDALLEEARKGKIEIVTSTVTVVEVAFAATEKATKILDQAVEDKISKLWLPPSPVRLIEFYELIAERARSLVRQAVPEGWSLQAMDAIHLSSAKQIGVEAFHTYDKNLDKYTTAMGFTIERPLVAQIELLLQPGASPDAEQI
jgi:predicted nucleic acid-binding protein